jgi:hypothetical protein
VFFDSQARISLLGEVGHATPVDNLRRHGATIVGFGTYCSEAKSTVNRIFWKIGNPSSHQLVDDLLLLWKEEGVRVWDAHAEEHFDLRALLFVTVNDWPALSNQSGHSNKSYKACTHCLDETDNMYLKHCRKIVYMGHR